MISLHARLMTLSMTGDNLGSSSDVVRVMWNGAPLSDVTMTTPHSALLLHCPSGIGQNITVSISVGGQPASCGNDSIASSACQTLQSLAYAPPMLRSIALQSVGNASHAMDCSESSLLPDGRSRSGGDVAVVITGMCQSCNHHCAVDCLQAQLELEVQPSQ
jgi:hypothetical protein